MRSLFHRRNQRKAGDLCVCPIATLLAIVSLFLFSGSLEAGGALNQESHETPGGSQAPATIVHLKLLLDDGPPAIEIITTAPVTPTIRKLDGPLRLAIDLPNTNMSVSHKEVPVKGEDVSAVSLELSATNPPLVHVEVDLLKPMDYTWEGAGNRLLVRLRTIEAKKVTPVAAPVETVDLGNVVPVERLASGASVTASSETTVLRLRRGGNFYVCPRTTVSVTRSRNGPDMMLAIGSGAVETHITLDNSADEVITPDFRILLRGPGEFDYAIRADSQGNTCVRTLPGNTSSAIIYELMGDGKFEFQPKDQIVLHGGRLNPEDTALHS
ncbi:MAG: AMIN domain-containing protein, partial [Candidatus Sulfotelmatobacter sp.]